MNLITSIQKVGIDEKIKSATNPSYEIGVFIGSLMPFLILVVIAYLIYRYNKNRINKN